MKMYLSRMMVVGALLATVATGCATTGGGGSAATDAEQIAAVFNQYGEGLVAQDIDKIMELVSENFQSGSKEDVREVFEDFRAQGAMDDIELDFDDAATEIDGNTATVGPLFISGGLGSAIQDFTLAKEADGVWRVVDIMQN